MAKRTFKLGSGAEIKCANYSDKKGSHLLLQLASYVPDQPTSTISKNNKTSSSSIQAEPAPNGKDYLDGDVFVLVNDNHVILCLSGVRDSVVDIYFRKILNKSKTKIETFTLDKVANISKVKMIQEQGVKELCLGASLYDASIEELDNKNLTMFGLTHSVAEQIKRIFAADPTLQTIQEKENLNIQVSIKFDGKEAMKHQKENDFGKVGKERLLKSSEQILSQNDDDGFTIITGSGNKISSGDVSVSESFKVSTLGKSLSRTNAWEKLEAYAEKLEETGIFSQ